MFKFLSEISVLTYEWLIPAAYEWLIALIPITIR